MSVKSKSIHHVWQTALHLTMLGVVLSLPILGCSQSGNGNGDNTGVTILPDEVIIDKSFVYSNTPERYQPSYNLRGTLAPIKQVDIVSPFDGYNLNLKVAEGDWVKKRQILAHLDSELNRDITIFAEYDDIDILTDEHVSLSEETVTEAIEQTLEKAIPDGIELYDADDKTTTYGESDNIKDANKEDANIEQANIEQTNLETTNPTIDNHSTNKYEDKGSVKSDLNKDADKDNSNSKQETTEAATAKNAKKQLQEKNLQAKNSNDNNVTTPKNKTSENNAKRNLDNKDKLNDDNKVSNLSNATGNNITKKEITEKTAKDIRTSNKDGVKENEKEDGYTDSEIAGSNSERGHDATKGSHDTTKDSKPIRVNNIPKYVTDEANTRKPNSSRPNKSDEPQPPQKVTASLTFRSPIAGEVIVIDKDIARNAKLAAHDTFITIADTRQLQLIGTLPLVTGSQSTESQLSVGQHVNFKVYDTNMEFSGQISHITPEPEKGYLTVRAPVIPSADNKAVLEYGMQAVMTIEYGQRELGVRVPRTAINEANLKSLNKKYTRPVSPISGYAWVIKQDEHLAYTPIEVVQYFPETDQFLVHGINNDSLICTANLPKSANGKRLSID